MAPAKFPRTKDVSSRIHTIELWELERDRSCNGYEDRIVQPLCVTRPTWMYSRIADGVDPVFQQPTLRSRTTAISVVHLHDGGLFVGSLSGSHPPKPPRYPPLPTAPFSINSSFLPAIWLIPLNILMSEVFLTLILSLIGVRVTRRIGRYANMRAAVSNWFAIGPKHLLSSGKLLTIRPKKGKRSTEERDLRYDVLVTPETSRGFRKRISHRVVTINDEFLMEPLILPLPVDSQKARVSLFLTAADTLIAHPRHVIKNDLVGHADVEVQTSDEDDD